jgi:hypothetical protein
MDPRREALTYRFIAATAAETRTWPPDRAIELHRLVKDALPDHVLELQGERALAWARTWRERGTEAANAAVSAGSTARPVPADGAAGIAQPGTLLQNEIRRAAGRDVRSCSIRVGVFALIAVVLVGSYPMAALALAAVAAIMALSLIPPLRLRARPEGHPTVAPLLAHHKISLDQLSLEVERERGRNTAAPTESGYELLPSYLYRSRGQTFALVRLEDVVWVYEKSTAHVRGGVEESRTHDVVVIASYAPAFELTLGTLSRETTDLIAHVRERAPWALAGFEEARQAAWRDPAKRAQMIAEVVASRDRTRGGA